jgi:hypothetical protein
MQMQVVHGLSAILAGVDDDAITAVELPAASQSCCGGQEVAQQGGVLGCGLGLRDDVLFRNNQEMNGSLWIDIRKTDAEFIFVNSVRRNLSFDDFAE